LFAKCDEGLPVRENSSQVVDKNRSIKVYIKTDGNREPRDATINVLALKVNVDNLVYCLQMELISQ